MEQSTKVLIVGGLVGGGLLWWWFSNHQQAAQQIVSQPTVPPSALPNVVNPAIGVSLVDPVGTSTTPGGQDQTQLSALLAWSQGTKNPSLYQQMINALTPSQLDSLYNILTTEWTTGAAPTTSQTAFWNGLRNQYPFLNKGGQGCTNFQCT
jgi:hypothetical protein